ncbi:MAG: gliding motility-associated C-terminal domain-containing protein [Bacteroidia bacterium]
MKITRSKTLLFALVFISKTAWAQNLVPNAGFENYSICPSAPGELWLAFPWDTLSANPDLFNECYLNSNYCVSVNAKNNFAGNAMSHSGGGYAGFVAKQNTNYREYLQTSLTSPLLSGKLYKVEAWFRRSSYSQFAVQTLGLTLSVGALSQSGTTYLGFPPQVETTAAVTDTSAWTLLQGFIIAAGGENNITIGNFRNDASSGIVSLPNLSVTCPLNAAYYYVDDVRVELINEQVSIVGDTIICPGASTTLYSNSNTVTWWSVSGDPSTPVSANTSLTVTPTVNTTYILNGIFYKDSVTVYIIPPPLVDLGNDTTICEENFVPLDAANINSTYSWSTGENSSTIIAAQNQLYWVTVDNGGCTATDTIDVTVLINPPIDLGSDTVFCGIRSDFITLDAGNGIAYLWSPNGETTNSITAIKEGTYSVTVDYINGCSKDTSITLKEVCDPVIFVPSSFTPNGDGINDLLFAAGNSFDTFDFAVFNRYGTLVFKSNDAAKGWDGTYNRKKLPAGIYVYLLKYSGTDESGKIISGQSHGTITIIR